MSGSEKPRRERLSQAIVQGLADLIPKAISDPRISAAGLLCVNHADLNADLSIATVYVAFVGADEKTGKRAVEALDGAAGHLRGPLGRHLGTARAPALRFRYDQSADFQARVSELVRDDEARHVEDDEGSD